MRALTRLFLTLSLCFPTLSFAKLLQIIHTNDLHSHYEHADDQPFGGYAQVKATMDRLRAAAVEQGIETLVLDAGDFSEGTPFYMVDGGLEAWRVMDAFGYDAVVLGNHDWLVGTKQLDEITRVLGKTHAQFLSANIDLASKYKSLKRTLKPYVTFNRAGAKIAILGLSTDEIAHSWRMYGGDIYAPNDSAEEWVPELRKNHDFVIALTHIGTPADMELVGAVDGIDLVVGGHSHDFLYRPVFVKNPSGHNIPIVQTGEHGKMVGDLLVDIEPGKPLKIVRYRLIPVLNDGEKDQDMDSRVKLVRQKLEEKYGRDWLYQILDFTEIPLERPRFHATDWGNFYADAMKEAVDADLSVDVGEFFGGTQPAGAITRETLFQFYPRVFNLKYPYGWTIWGIKVPGWILKFVVETADGMGRYLNISGLTWETYEKNGERHYRNFRVNGRSLLPLWNYNVAVPEGIGRGAKDLNFLLRLIFMPQNSGLPIWQAVEERIRRVGPPSRLPTHPLD